MFPTAKRSQQIPWRGHGWAVLCMTRSRPLVDNMVKTSSLSSVFSCCTTKLSNVEGLSALWPYLESLSVKLLIMSAGSQQHTLRASLSSNKFCWLDLNLIVPVETPTFVSTDHNFRFVCTSSYLSMFCLVICDMSVYTQDYRLQINIVMSRPLSTYKQLPV